MTQSPVHCRVETGDAEPLARPDIASPCTLLLFGATGDLAQRKILPALFQLALDGVLPQDFAIVGVSRSAPSDEALRERFRDALAERFGERFDLERWSSFAAAIFASRVDVGDPASVAELKDKLSTVAADRNTRGNLLVYLATPPSTFAPILTTLGANGLLRHAREQRGGPWSRAIIEKPFGRELASARELNRMGLEVIDEEQLFRIDHYLGKETVQNILVFRFGNAMFEPLWNQRHIEHVQITMAEEIGVEGRGAFYEETGVVRDIVQNHMLQVLALCAMEAPVSFEADEIRNMKAQLLRSLRVPQRGLSEEDVVFGQYAGYADEPGVAEGSTTPTYFAMKVLIDNWRWHGVPFYIRAGKGLAQRRTEVSFHLKPIPSCLFGTEEVCQRIEPNVLKLCIQPDEGISLNVVSKVPGEELRIGNVAMDFQYGEVFQRRAPEAYERLLLDSMRGDQTLFARGDEVELSWAFVEPLLDMPGSPGCDVESYELGSEGPLAARRLMSREGRRWQAIR